METCRFELHTEAISQLGPPSRHARFSNVRSSVIGSPMAQRLSGPCQYQTLDACDPGMLQESRSNP